MAGEYTLSVLITAQNQASSVISGFLSSLGPVGGAVAVVGAVVAGVGIASIKMAADYQQSMNKVQALTGSTAQQMAQYDTGVKQLAVDAGVAPKKLSDGLYNVLSAGYKGADAMKVLTLATEDAKIGMTSSTVTTDALTNVMASFSVKASDATRVNGEMLQTVTLGKATFEQYATTIVKSASAASQFHVSMETMNAAWATMTSNGIRAAQASTDFQQSLKVMYGNIGTVTKSLHSNGIAFDEAKFNAMDYGHKVQYLNAALDQANAKHVKVTGVTLQAAQAISTISKHIGMYNDNLATLSNKQAMAQKTAEAWKITQGGFNQIMSRLSATVDVVMISIGQKLLPVLTDLMNQIIPVVANIGDWLVKSGFLNTAADVLGKTISVLVGFITNFVTIAAKVVDWFINVKGPGEIVRGLLIGIGAAFAIIQIGAFIATIPALVAGFLAWAGGAMAAAVATLLAMAPLLLIGLAIAAAVALIILAVTHWGAIMDWITNKTAQDNIKMQINQSKHAEVLDQQQKASAAKTIANLEKQRQDILAKIKATNDSVEKENLQHQLKLTDQQITQQKQRQKKADDDIAVQKKKQKKLHDDLIESHKDMGTRIDDAVNTWTKTAEDNFDKFFGNVFSNIGTWVHNMLDKVGQLKDQFLQKITDLWNIAVAWVRHQIDVMKNDIETWKQTLINKAEDLKNQFIAKVQTLINNVTTFFTNLPGQALTWGQNLIQGFINGINNMVGAAGQAASNVVNTVKSFLGFHSPAKTGPGADADQWAPNLMKMYARGIQGGLPGIKVAVANAAKLMKAGFTGDADALDRKINTAQYQLYLDAKSKAHAAYQQREIKHAEAYHTAEQKRYEKYLQERAKAYTRYEQEKHHKKAFSYHAFNAGKGFKDLKETLPKFTGLSLGAFANKTSIYDPSMGSGAAMSLTGSGSRAAQTTTIHLEVHGDVVNHDQLLDKLNKLADKRYRSQGTHSVVTSGGRAR